MSDILVWQDIFDLFQERVDLIKGRFRGNNDVEYAFHGKWDEKNQRWILNFWIA